MFRTKRLPELYTEGEEAAVEAHIATWFGESKAVLHEAYSPDIRVDVCVVAPTSRRKHYTLVTRGMGAHRMKVPWNLRREGIDRAELLMALPPDWNIKSEDERWYWPVHCLRSLARLPGAERSWLGYGHTVSNGEPFTKGTRLCGVMLTDPYLFDEEADICTLPNGDRVNFYQVLPLYGDEIEFAYEHGTEALEDLFPEDIDLVVDPSRRSMVRGRGGAQDGP